MSLILSGTNGLSDVDGSAATPAIRGTDTNTGIFFPAADTIAFAEGGAEVARFDSSGNFGLGVTPAAWFSDYRVAQMGSTASVYGRATTNETGVGQNWYRDASAVFRYIGNGFAAAYIQLSGGGHGWFNGANNVSGAGASLTLTQAMTLDASGNFGVGTASPLQRLDVASDSTAVYQTIRTTSSGATNVALRIQDGTTGTTNSDGIYLGRTGAINYLWTYENEPWVFGTNNAERMRLDAAGNLGLGVTPSAWQSGRKALQVGNASINSFSNSQNQLGANFYFDGTNNKYISSDFSTVYQQLSGQHQWYIAASGTAGNNITFTQAMTLDASGRLTVGYTSAANAEKLGTNGTVISTGQSINSFSYDQAGFDYNSSTKEGRFFSTASGGAGFLTFYTASGSERARIISTGTFLVGKSTAGDTVIGSQIGETGYITATRSQSTNSDTTYHVYSTGAGAYRFYVGMGGTVYATSTTISAISDTRFKENVRDLNVGLSEIMALKPRLYDWKEGKGANIKNARGFIAQEFEEVFPDLIDEWKDPAPEGEEPYKSVRQDLIPVLVKAIQELKAEFDAYKLTHP